MLHKFVLSTRLSWRATSRSYGFTQSSAAYRSREDALSVLLLPLRFSSHLRQKVAQLTFATLLTEKSHDQILHFNSRRMNPDAFIVPYSNQVESVDTAKSSDESKIPRGAMLRRSRLLAVTGHDQELALQEEVVLVENSFQRERLEHELWESRRRIEEQGLVLDTRSQQLLNYTREHVEQSRAESERRIEAFMEDKIQVSHGNIQDDIRQHTHNLALQIQEQLCAERQHDVEDIEMRLLRQSTHFQQALELTEQRDCADVRGVAAAQVQGWNDKLEGVKLWTREYVDSPIQAQDEVNGANQSNQMQQYVDHRLSGYESHVEDLISARIWEERTTMTMLKQLHSRRIKTSRNVSTTRSQL
jgi:hypothetical protein